MSACALPEPPQPVGPPPQSDAKPYCAAFETISFAELMPGAAEDATNKADTAETVTAILAHNAVWFALCTNPLAPPG